MCIRDRTETAPYLFREWEEAKEKLSIKDYDNKYEIELDDELDVIILEKLFELFNINHPKDYQCRSMSVSYTHLRCV